MFIEELYSLSSNIFSWNVWGSCRETGKYGLISGDNCLRFYVTSAIMLDHCLQHCPYISSTCSVCWYLAPYCWVQVKYKKAQETQNINPLPAQCWPNVCDAGLTLSQHWLNWKCGGCWARLTGAMVIGHKHQILRCSINGNSLTLRSMNYE